jgi:hypothetical protein
METLESWRVDMLSREELRLLIEQRAGSCASLFLPIQRAEPARQQNRIRLERLLDQAATRLLARDLSPTATQSLLAPARELVEDQAFWEHQSDGLAIFAAPQLFRVYRLPLAFEELLVIDERLHITPLLPLFSDDGQFYVLTLGLQGVQLLQGAHYSLRPIALPSVPTSLQDALKYDEFAKQPQWHPGVPGHGGERGAIFHGQGARDDRVAKEEILRYFQQVDRGVCTVLRDKHAPLLLAGVAYLLPIYRAANHYSHLMEEGLATNPDDLQPEALLARAWELVAPHFAHARTVAVEHYQQLRGAQLALASSYLRAIVPAAYAGRIETLFVAIGQRQWGTFDPATGVLALHEAAESHDSELLDLAAGQVIRHGGTVYLAAPEQMPESAPLAAIFRW